MAADPADVAQLVRKLRGKGLSDAQVQESLQGLGYTKAQAAAAVGASTPAAAHARAAATTSRTTKKKTARTGAGRKGGSPAAPSPAAPPATDAGPVGGGWKPPMPKLETPTLTPPRKLSGGDLGGFFAGLLLYTLALNYLRYGAEGPKGWLRAKFLNQPAAFSPPLERQTEPRRTNRQAAFTSTRPQRPQEV